MPSPVEAQQVLPPSLCLAEAQPAEPQYRLRGTGVRLHSIHHGHSRRTQNQGAQWHQQRNLQGEDPGGSGQHLRLRLLHLPSHLLRHSQQNLQLPQPSHLNHVIYACLPTPVPSYLPIRRLRRILRHHHRYAFVCQFIVANPTWAIPRSLTGRNVEQDTLSTGSNLE